VRAIRLFQPDFGKRDAKILIVADHKFAAKTAWACDGVHHEFEDDLLPEQLRQHIESTPDETKFCTVEHATLPGGDFSGFEVLRKAREAATLVHIISAAGSRNGLLLAART
jgi:hypothetical protein